MNSPWLGRLNPFLMLRNSAKRGWKRTVPAAALERRQQRTSIFLPSLPLDVSALDQAPARCAARTQVTRKSDPSCRSAIFQTRAPRLRHDAERTRVQSFREQSAVTQRTRMTGELLPLAHHTKTVVVVTAIGGAEVAVRRTRVLSEVAPRPAPNHAATAGGRATRISNW